LIFTPFEDELFFEITSRYGGVSEAPYDSLNLALHVGDKPLKVLENRTLVAKKYDFYIENLIYMDQVHGCNIEVIKDCSINKIENCDGIITNVKNIPLMVMVADCVPILFFDKVKKVIAVAHAGRNGTLKEISKKTILKMMNEFNSVADDILVYLGASIGQCCYEVGEEIANIIDDRYIENRDGEFYLDILSMNIHQLQSVGIKEENIQMQGICTCCDKNYFSYRREGATGRFAGILKLK
jgi:hypothetical protein